ncbi:hypothetical protein [Bradyrhizobium sp. LA6.12]|uniref:hypothetical protein n=1 Tax=unclassified Bradyrhizobium TaxID=2631580 RepID=UPI003393FD21
MGKGYVDLTPEQRAAAGERARSLKSPHRQTDEERERLRLMSERLGITPQRVREIGERLGLRKVVTEPPAPEPQAPMPRKTRKPGGGNKPKLTEEVERGKQTYRRMLDENPKKWRNQEAAANELIKKLKLGDRVSWQTVKRVIVAPVLKERAAQNKQSPRAE